MTSSSAGEITLLYVRLSEFAVLPIIKFSMRGLNRIRNQKIIKLQISMIVDNDDGCIFVGESIFSIKSPIWTSEEKYNFACSKRVLFKNSILDKKIY